MLDLRLGRTQWTPQDDRNVSPWLSRRGPAGLVYDLDSIHVAGYRAV
jgi:hypothetical protein